jgi:hypothetical protein
VEQPWKAALVTGASAGIGAEFARQLAKGGADVVLVARRADRLTDLAAELQAAGVTVEVVAADLTAAADLARVAERLADPEKPIDLLVNCAGVGAAGPFVDGDPATAHQMIDLNVTALVELTHAALSTMQARQRGWVLNVSSLGGHAPGPSFAVYSATKAFVTSFSESLFEEVRGTGVHVTVVCPGATKTEFGQIAGTQADDLPGFLQQSAQEVVAEALEAAAKGRAVRVTGLINRVTAGLSTVLPRSANRRLSALVTDRL